MNVNSDLEVTANLQNEKSNDHVRNCNNSDDSDSDGWDEMEPADGMEPSICLFCNEEYSQIMNALNHCSTGHKFDLYSFTKKHNMKDIYSYIKLINYIRKHQISSKTLLECDQPLWLDDEYLKPVISDQWLMFDFEDWIENCQKNDATFENNKETRVAETLQSYFAQIEQQKEIINRAMEDIKKMQEVTRNLVENTQLNNEYSKNIENESYFTSYAHFGIHHQMLTDKVRTETYRSAILNNSKSFSDKLVLDLGCGTGILSMFSAQAGAKHVIGVDQSAIIYQAMDIIRENGFYDKVQLIHGEIENIKLPYMHVDIIVSEWMGYFLLFEGMLDSFIYARDKHLSPGGILLPNRCTLLLTGCCDLDRHKELIGFWNDVYGFKMTSMIGDTIAEASVEIVPSDNIITTSATILDLDLYTCTKNAVNFESLIELKALNDGHLTSIVGYFDTYFTSMSEDFTFSTGPDSTPTHWKQTIFYLRDPIPVKKDEVIKGSIKCSRGKNELRSLIVHLKIGN
ncbi:protein arginine N-methyltransferase 1, partial [Chrysoperla carnea]|uniref:protein arginine N-methyltransferase 1 n=1 Tax=Chrysoperla carnea TaxID=189513 RepID=UPI001D081311